MFIPIGLLLFAILVVVAIKLTFNVLREYERAVIFRLGRIARGLYGGNGPGLVIIVPFIDRLVRVSLRTVAMDVPPQDVITKDNVTVKVNAVIYFRVVDQERAIIKVEDYLYATSMMSQTTLRSVLGQSQLDDLLSKPFQSVHCIARRKLLSLNAATSLNDLRAVPGNRFEALKQDRAGQHAIRVNDQYRICFVWRQGDAYEVEITKHYS